MTRSGIPYKLVAVVLIGLCSTAVLNGDEEVTALLADEGIPHSNRR